MPFDIEMMQQQNPEMASRLEDYASTKTQDDFFDDLMIVDLALPARSPYDDPRDSQTDSLLRHLLVNKENNDVLGSFYNNDFSANMRTSQQGDDAKFHRSNEETSYR